MVSICERSINVVRKNEPKMLTGLSQKALWRVQELGSLLPWTTNATGEKSGPNPLCDLHRTW
jgi:hypothetical protein